MEEVKDFKKKSWGDTKNTFDRDPEKVRYGLKDFYAYYRRNLERDEAHSVYVQKNGVYSAVLRLFFGKIMKMMIYDGFIFKMPCHMGNWLIVKQKIKIFVNPDDTVSVYGAKSDKVRTSYLHHVDKKAKEENKQVYHLNEHTGGYRFRFRWQIMLCNAKNKTAYGFYPDDIHRRALYKAAIDPDFKINFSDITKKFVERPIRNTSYWRAELDKLSKEEEINLN